MSASQGCIGCRKPITSSSEYCLACSCGNAISVHTKGGSQPFKDQEGSVDRIQAWVNNVDSGTPNTHLPNRSYSVYHSGSAASVRHPINAYGRGPNDGLIDRKYGYYNVVDGSAYFQPHASNAEGGGPPSDGRLYRRHGARDIGSGSTHQQQRSDAGQSNRKYVGYYTPRDGFVPRQPES